MKAKINEVKYNFKASYTLERNFVFKEISVNQKKRFVNDS